MRFFTFGVQSLIQCLLLARKLLNNRQLTILKGPKKARKVLGLSKSALACVLYSASIKQLETEERFPFVLQKHAMNNTMTLLLYRSQGWRISTYVFPTSKRGFRKLSAVSISTGWLLFNTRYILKNLSFQGSD